MGLLADNEEFPPATFEARGLKFTLTSPGCPEQYDVTNGKGQEVGYVRLRWGHLRAEVYFPWDTPKGRTIYEHSFGDNWQGNFNDQQERDHHLSKIAKAIKEALKNPNGVL